MELALYFSDGAFLLQDKYYSFLGLHIALLINFAVKIFYHWISFSTAFHIPLCCCNNAFFKYCFSKHSGLKFFFFLDMDTPELTPSNGLTPIENTNYTLRCTINSSNPNPITKYQWFQNDKKIDHEGRIFSFYPIKRENSGSWYCKGTISESSITIEKKSNVTQVNVFCK